VYGVGGEKGWEGEGKGEGGGRVNRAVSDVGISWLTKGVGEGAKMKKIFKLGFGFCQGMGAGLVRLRNLFVVL